MQHKFSWRLILLFSEADGGRRTSVSVMKWNISIRHRYRTGNNFGNAILGFDLSTEEFILISLSQSLIGSWSGLSILKYGESSIAVILTPSHGKLYELWVMKEYGVVESWTKVLTLPTDPRYAWFPKVMGFRKNREVLLHMHNAKMASLDLNSQQISYVESLVLLDKAVNVHSGSDVNHPIDSSDSDESSGGESDLAYD
ncbi:hypothetical protein V6N11_019377 [Hibiscus sabdariffa]|uniref:F-box associated domain-containing protein n=1 Tax=Hibiscus sabdariffa TaxID=183260 RepID=A0ABR2R277_9ROSI